MNALIIGGLGQDGRLLERHLTAGGVNVTPLGRGDIDLGDFTRIRELLRTGSYDGIYYLAAHHHSSQDAEALDELELYRHSAGVHIDGLIHFLEAIRTDSPGTRLFYAGSALVFGSPLEELQNEGTPFDPRCAYGITKATGLRLCRLYRDKHGVFASGGILFNHESPLRQPKFVIPKIVNAALSVSRGSDQKLLLGDLSARVDWGYAPDYVDAMARILRLPEPGDFVIATGETHSVRDVVEIVFDRLNLDWRPHVEEAPGILTRKRAVLCGDFGKLHTATKWRPSVTFQEMLTILVEARQNTLP